jgi:hypothetical protein
VHGNYSLTIYYVLCRQRTRAGHIAQYHEHRTTILLPLHTSTAATNHLVSNIPVLRVYERTIYAQTRVKSVIVLRICAKARTHLTEEREGIIPHQIRKKMND